MNVNTNITIDLVRPGSIPPVAAMQNDVETRTVTIQLMENGTAWEIPDDALPMVVYRKLSGVSGQYDTVNDKSAFEVDGSKITVTFASQLFTSPGLVTAAVVFSSESGQRLSTFPFSIDVRPSPNSEGVPEDTGSDSTGGASIFVLPTATVTQTADGATISVTDKNGTTTATVRNGKDGKDGQPGADGRNGVDGKDGRDGQDGLNGSDGVGIDRIVLGEEDGVMDICFTDGTVKTVHLPKGEKGDKGDTGLGIGYIDEPGDGTIEIYGTDGNLMGVFTLPKGEAGPAGADGKTPVRGVDYYTDADENEIVGKVAAIVNTAQVLPNTYMAENADIGYWDALECVYLFNVYRPLVVGEAYTVTIDGVDYTAVAESYSLDNFIMDGVALRLGTCTIYYQQGGTEFVSDYNTVYSPNEVGEENEAGGAAMIPVTMSIRAVDSDGAKPLVVTVTNGTASHTSAQIAAHVRSGGTAVLKSGDDVYNFASYYGGGTFDIATFISVDPMDGERFQNIMVTGTEVIPYWMPLATEPWVQENCQPKGEYLERTELTTAIDTALAQAKASGAFDGPQGEKGEKGDPGPAYTLTDSDRETIANAVIEALPVYSGEVL